MTDRELLELAAKAACFSSDDIDYEWNPLAYDGDALRLAVKLRLAVFPPENGLSGDFAVASIPNGIIDDIDDDTWIQEFVINGDNDSATRRAIVRAAAEIGKVMK